MDNADRIINSLKSLKKPSTRLIALDGRCASGKTTLAMELSERLGCNVVHIDDFYLPFAERTPQRMSEPGGNIDFARLLGEILLPLKSGKNVAFRPYDCHGDAFGAELRLDAGRDTVIEGSYSCHPQLRELYDLRIFMTVSAAEQERRLRSRNPAMLEAFKKTWIPREEAYFELCEVAAHCELIIET